MKRRSSVHVRVKAKGAATAVVELQTLEVAIEKAMRAPGGGPLVTFLEDHSLPLGIERATLEAWLQLVDRIALSREDRGVYRCQLNARLAQL